MSREECEAIMTRHGVRPTANRMLVLEVLKSCGCTMSIYDIEQALQTVDKSTIFRVLSTFLEHHMVHAIDDGSGSVKYELCSGEDSCTIADMHPHFYCEMCHRVICIKSVDIPVVGLPDGFSINSVNYMIKGICSDCSSKSPNRR